MEREERGEKREKSEMSLWSGFRKGFVNISYRVDVAVPLVTEQRDK